MNRVWWFHQIIQWQTFFVQSDSGGKVNILVGDGIDNCGGKMLV